jgi:hypothetical protein
VLDVSRTEILNKLIKSLPDDCQPKLLFYENGEVATDEPTNIDGLLLMIFLRRAPERRRIRSSHRSGATA